MRTEPFPAHTASSGISMGVIIPCPATSLEMEVSLPAVPYGERVSGFTDPSLGWPHTHALAARRRNSAPAPRWFWERRRRKARSASRSSALTWLALA